MLDHIIILIGSLEPFRKEFEADTGVTLTVGGAHPGLGTANLLASIGDRAYMEFMAPDPALDEPHGLGGRLTAEGEPRIGGFAARTQDMPATVAELDAAGLTAAGPTAGSRTTPDGSLLSWTTLFAAGHAHGDHLPFFIDWGATPHPSTTSAQGLKLLSFQAVHPEPDGLAELYRRLGIPVTVVAGAVAGFQLRLLSPRGERTFASELGARLFAPDAMSQE